MKTALSFLLCLLLGGLTSRAEDKADIIRKALATSANLSRLEIRLWYHSGDKESGYLISGDGTVLVLSKPSDSSLDFSIVKSDRAIANRMRLKLSEKEVRQIAEAFAGPTVLHLPKFVPELVEPKEAWPKQMRYSASISYNNELIHEFEHPCFRFSELKQTPEAKRLIEKFQSAVSGLERRIEKEDQKYLTSTKILALLGDDKENLWLELEEIGIWGGTSICVSDHGIVQWEIQRPPHDGEEGMQVARFSKKIGRGAPVALFRKAVETGIFDIVRQREIGVADEYFPKITIRALVNEEEFSRSIWLWAGEARETKNFAHFHSQILALAHPGNWSW